MGNPPLIVGLLIHGVAYAAIFIVIALVIRRFTNAAVWRVLVVVSLFVAAGLYVVFALRAGESTLWIVIEVLGVAIFGGMGLACSARYGGSSRVGHCTPSGTSGSTSWALEDRSPPKPIRSPASVSTFWSPPTSPSLTQSESSGAARAAAEESPKAGRRTPS